MEDEDYMMSDQDMNDIQLEMAFERAMKESSVMNKNTSKPFMHSVQMHTAGTATSTGEVEMSADMDVDDESQDCQASGSCVFNTAQTLDDDIVLDEDSNFITPSSHGNEPKVVLEHRQGGYFIEVSQR